MLVFIGFSFSKYIYSIHFLPIVQIVVKTLVQITRPGVWKVFLGVRSVMWCQSCSPAATLACKSQLYSALSPTSHSPHLSVQLWFGSRPNLPHLVGIQTNTDLVLMFVSCNLSVHKGHNKLILL